MPRRPGHLRSLLLVAGEAHLGLSDLLAHAIVLRVDLMARGAGDVARLVRAAVPVRTRRVLAMAAHAGVVARLDRRQRCPREGTVGLRPLGGVRRLVDVRIALAMAAGAGRRAPVRHRAVARLADRQHGKLVVLIVAPGAPGVAFQHQVLACLGLLGDRFAGG